GGHIRPVDNAVDDREIQLRIVFCDRLDDRSLDKADPDNEVVTALGERTHRGLNRCGIARFNIAKDERKFLRGTACPRPCGGIERPVVLASEVIDHTDVYLRPVVGRITPPLAGQEDHSETKDQNTDEELHRRDSSTFVREAIRAWTIR